MTALFKGTFEEKDVAQLTASNGSLTGTTPAVAIATTREGGWYRAPHTDSARSALNTNDLRGKVNPHPRQGRRHRPRRTSTRPTLGQGGAYTIPKGNLFPLVAGAPQAKTRPEIYAMGFRNPFRISGRRERRRLRDRLLARLARHRSSTTARPARAASRSSGTLPTTAGRTASRADLPEYPWNVNLQVPMDALTHQPVPAGQTPQPYSCAGGTVPNNDYWNINGGPGHPAGPDADAGPHGPGHLVLVQRQHGPRAAGHAVLRRVRPERHDRTARQGLDHSVPAPVPGPVHRRRGAARSRKYHFDPDNPSTTKFPPYYDNKVVILGEFNTQPNSGMRELVLDSKNHIQTTTSS